MTQSNENLIDLLFQKINEINISNIEHNKTLINKIENMDNEIKNLTKKVKNLEKLIKISNNQHNSILIENESQEDINELKKENIDIDSSIVLRALSFYDNRTIIILFKELYYKQENIIDKYPIRLIGKRSYEYYLNKQWISDIYGHYIKDVLLNNIQTILFKYNTYEYIKDSNVLIKNQDFIYKITSEKCSKIYFRIIIQEIRNTN